MASKKKPAKAGDVTTVVGGVKALISHLSAKAWNEALADIYAIGKELWLGFAVPQLTMAKLEVSGDCCSDEAIESLCKELSDCCDKCEECDGDEEKMAKLCPAKVDAVPAAVGPWISLFGPLLLQALQAIINGLMKEKEAKPA